MISPENADIHNEHIQELNERRMRLGDSHPDVAETLNALGLFYHYVVGDLERAYNYHVQALEILRSQEEGSYNVEVAVTLADVGNLYRSMKYCEKAITVYEEAIEIFREENVPESHPAVLGTKRSVLLIQRGAIR